MTEVQSRRQVDIKRFVSVEFDAENRPEIEDGKRTFQLVSVQISYTWEDGKWNPNHYYSRGVRRQKLKDGSWGAPVAISYLRGVGRDVLDEYAPTSTIELSEVEA